MKWLILDSTNLCKSKKKKDATNLCSLATSRHRHLSLNNSDTTNMTKYTAANGNPKNIERDPETASSPQHPFCSRLDQRGSQYPNHPPLHSGDAFFFLTNWIFACSMSTTWQGESEVRSWLPTNISPKPCCPPPTKNIQTVESLFLTGRMLAAYGWLYRSIEWHVHVPRDHMDGKATVGCLPRRRQPWCAPRCRRWGCSQLLQSPGRALQ